MVKRGLVFFVLMGFVFSLTGCASMTKQKDLEIQGLKNQVSVLESQVQSKDEEISSLRDSLNKAEVAQTQAEEAAAAKNITKKKKEVVACKIKSRPKVKHIQVALRSAGFYSGPVDGKMDKGTREAVKAFQRANGLTPDGRVGKATWKVLRDYLTKKIK